MGSSTTFRAAAIASTCLADRVRSDRIWESAPSNGIPLQQVGFTELMYVVSLGLLATRRRLRESYVKRRYWPDIVTCKVRA